MSVSDLDTGAIYTGNGATTSFPINFDFESNSEVSVFAIVIATGVIEPKVLTTDYTISGSNVIMNTAPPNTRYLVVERAVALTQTYDFTANTAPFSEQLEEGLDAIVRMVQDLAAKIGRTPSFDRRADLSSFDLRLPPDLVGEAGASLVLNDDGDGFIVGPTADEIENAQTYANNAAASATAASNSAIAAAASAVAADASADAAAISETNAGAFAATAQQYAPVVLGSFGSARVIDPAVGFTTSAGHYDNNSMNVFVFCAGLNTGDNDISASPQIEAGFADGALLTIIMVSATNFITLENGTGLRLNGTWTANNQGDSIQLIWDGTVWNELSRSN